MSAILSIKNLSVAFQSRKIIDNISFVLKKSEIMALVGESGSGKSSVALALMNLLHKAEISGGVFLHDADDLNLLNLFIKDWQKIRGKNIAIVFQDPNSALNPLHKIGDQIAEAIKIHNKKISRQKLQKRIDELLEIVELKGFKSRLHDFPHQFSGGQKQRIMIALALANNPEILLLDEPTTALDSETQDEILKLILRLKNELGLAILFITHNLNIVKKIANEVLVLKNGIIIESGKIADVLQN